jgi:hypothetical protein
LEGPQRFRDRRREVEAEAVAYLVASRAGLATGSAAYLRLHAERADKKIDIDLSFALQLGSNG